MDADSDSSSSIDSDAETETEEDESQEAKRIKLEPEEAMNSLDDTLTVETMKAKVNFNAYIKHTSETKILVFSQSTISFQCGT